MFGQKTSISNLFDFLQRAYDQLIHDVAIQNLDVMLAIDRAGFVGEDGATHAGIFDLSFLRCVPNLTLMTPSDENELWLMLNTGYDLKTPVAVRYPRGSGPGSEISHSDEKIEIGKAKVVKEIESDVVLLSFGSLLPIAEEISDELNYSLIDMRFVKPYRRIFIIKTRAIK